MKKTLFSFKDIDVDFYQKGHPTRILDKINLNIYEKEIIGLIGKTGSGKSMLAWLLMDLLPGNGKLIHGKILYRSKNCIENRLSLRGEKIAMVFQDPMRSLNPAQRIGKQFFIVLKKRFGYSFDRSHSEAIEWIKKVQLKNPENILGRFPHQLSGGQMQRVMIALSMSVRPEFLIADEATTSLDANIKIEIIDLINSLRNETKTTVLLISHDLLLAKQNCDRIAVMNNGHIVEVNNTIDIFNHPKHDYTKILINRFETLMKKSSEKNIQKNRKIILSIKNIEKTYADNYKNISALKHVSLDIYKQETVGIIGESGSGKTTLVKIILNILKRDSGSIILFNDDGSEKNLSEPDPRIGVVFQDPQGSLNPRMTIFNIIAEPLIIFGSKDRVEINNTILKIMDKVNLNTNLLGRFPYMLSGGQQQRVSIARALVLKPDILVLDEPTSSLDIHIQEIILDLLKEIQRLEKLTYLFVSHDLSVLSDIADHIAVLYKGEIIEQRTAQAVLNNPQEQYTKKLISAFFDKNN